MKPHLETKRHFGFSAIGCSFGIMFCLFANAAESGEIRSATMILTDSHGVEHTVSNCNNDQCFFRAGTPFDDNITDSGDDTDYKAPGGGFWKRASALSETIIIEFHTPGDQATISKVALERGIRKAELDQTHVLLLIPYPCIESIKFTGQINGDRTDGKAKSEVRLAGGAVFEAGGAFGKLEGKEKVASLGIADFSVWARELIAIRSADPPIQFKGDSTFFGCSEKPFSAKIVDTAGSSIVLSNAMYCTTKSIHAQLLGYVNTTTLTTVDFSSILPIKFRGTSSMQVPSSKLSKLELGKVDDKVPGYLAKALLGTGEQLEVAVTPQKGIYVPSGVFGISDKGWVWLPWYAIASIEYLHAK